MGAIQVMKEEKHIRNAWITGTISAILTFIVSMIGAYSENVRMQYGCDTWTLLDVALIAGLTYGIYRRNRYCALGMLIYYLTCKFIAAASTGKFTGGIMAIIFAYFFFQGTRASFKLHKYMHKEEAQVLKNGRSWKFYTFIGFLTIILIPILILVVMAALGPDTEVVPGKMLNVKYVNFIRGNKLIEPTEQIEYWYSDALVDFRNGFYVLTDRKVLLYCKDWEKKSITVPFSSISDIQFQKETSFFEVSRITIFLSDGSTVFFPVSNENNGDEKFFKRMRQMWGKSKD